MNLDLIEQYAETLDQMYQRYLIISEDKRNEKQAKELIKNIINLCSNIKKSVEDSRENDSSK